MRDQLTSLSKGEILWIFRHLNGGQVGFNFEPVQKLDLIDRLQLAFTEEQLLAVLSQGLPEVNPKGIATSEEGRPVPPVTKPSAPAVKPDANAALAALQALLSPTVDEATVRQIVMAEVKKAMDDSPIVKIEIVRPDGSAHKVEGHTRPEFKDVLLSASCGLNILLVGPAGCGKTHLAHQVAEALGRPFASVSCTAGMSESALQGWLIPVEGYGYLPSDFVKMYEEGGVFLFDEIDGSDSNTLLFLNQALANGSFFLPIRKDASIVKRHPDFVCIAAANTFGTGSNQTYAGRERLDESTLDRFRAGTIVLDYDQTFERKVVAPDLLAWGWAIRKRISEARLNRVMSTRFLLDATKLLKAGKSVKAIQDTYFIGWKADERSKVEV
jgi:cobaltochelatase CobS